MAKARELMYIQEVFSWDPRKALINFHSRGKEGFMRLAETAQVPDRGHGWRYGRSRGGRIARSIPERRHGEEDGKPYG